MKKLVLSFFAFTGVCSLSAQHYALPFKDLNGQFVEIYSQTDKKKNLIERLSETTNFFFSIQNEPVKNAVGGLQRKYKLAADSVGNIIFDTVMISFVHYHLWDEFPNPKEKYLSFLAFYNSKLCPCISEKIRQSPLQRLEETDMAQCAQHLLADTSYVNGAKRIMESPTMNELYEAGQMGLHYMYQHCPSFYNYYSDIIRYSIHNFVGELNAGLNNFDNTIIQLYKTQSPGLAKNFPAYKKYETELKSARDMMDQTGLFTMHDRTKNAAGQLTIVNTYYTYRDKKVALFGQTIFVLEHESSGSPVLSFRFTPAAKMKDSAKYLARINEEEVIMNPPPRIDDKIEIRIDTTQRKN